MNNDPIAAFEKETQERISAQGQNQALVAAGAAFIRNSTIPK